MDKGITLIVFLAVFVLAVIVSGTYYANLWDCKQQATAIRICKADERCKPTVEDIKVQVRCETRWGGQP